MEGKKENQIWYVVMKYKIKTSLWFMWPIIIGADCAAIILWEIDP